MIIYLSTMGSSNGPIRLLKMRLINHLSTYKLFINLQDIYQLLLEKCALEGQRMSVLPYSGKFSRVLIFAVLYLEIFLSATPAIAHAALALVSERACVRTVYVGAWRCLKTAILKN